MYGDAQLRVAHGGSVEELGTIERSIEINASPDTVFEVITSPVHLTEWWPDEALFEPIAGAEGRIVFGDRSAGDVNVPNITIVEIDPPRRFTFRWLHPDDEVASGDNSLLVVFELQDLGGRTLLRMTETGFREQGWDIAMLEEQYRLHDAGWDRHLARLVSYAPTVEFQS